MFKTRNSSTPSYLAQQPIPRIFVGELPAKKGLTDPNLLTKAANTNGVAYKPFDSKLDRQLDTNTQKAWEKFELQLGVNLGKPIERDSLIVASMIAASRPHAGSTPDNLESASQLDASTQAAWDSLPESGLDNGPKANINMFGLDKL